MISRAVIIAALLGPGGAIADTLMAARVIRADAIIEPGDVVVSEAAFPGALTGETDIAGLEARITLYPGRPIMPSHVGPAAVVTRNQQVTLIYRHGNLSIATEARSLARGGVGDTVRVMNLASRSTVVGRVRPDGAIEVPVERSDN